MIRPGIRRALQLALRLRRVREREVDDEIRAHLELRAEQLVRHGVPEAEAMAEAARRFGPMTESRTRLIEVASDRDNHMRKRESMDVIRHDLVYAIRQLRRSPGFTIAAVLTLALGIGANATMFGIVDRLLFRTPAFVIAPERTSRVYITRVSNGKEITDSHFGYKRYTDVRESTRSFEAIAPFFSIKLAVGSGDATRMMDVGVSAADLWKLFAIQPFVGRFFTEADDAPPNGQKVIVLSYAFWQTQFGGRPDAVGEAIDVGPDRYTVIGVSPPGFEAFAQTPLVGIVPITALASAFTPNPSWYRSYASNWFQDVFVRRKPDVSPTAADADLTLALARSWEAQRGQSRGASQIAPLDAAKPRAFAGPLLLDRGPNARGEAKVAAWLGGVAATVLLIACANVANLLLARAFNRRREIAVRLALGVSRRRLLLQLMIESLALAAFGAATGLFVARVGGSAIGAMLLTGVQLPTTLTDVRLLLFCAALALCTGVFTGLAPAVHAGRTDIAAALKSGPREGAMRRSRIQLGLLVLQAALSVVLLVGAGLFVRSLSNVKNIRLGFDADRLLWVDVDNRSVKLDSVQEVALRRQLLASAKTLPGIENAARAVSVPFFQSMYMYLHVDGMDSLSKLGRFDLQATTPEVFATMGTRVLRGRGIAAEDREGAPRSIVVSEAMAKRIWPSGDAIGKCIHMSADTTPCFTVVGIAEDVRQASLSEPALHYYISADQYQTRFTYGGLFVRTAGSASAQAERVRHELQKLLPGAAYVTVTPFSTILGNTARSWTLGATLFAAFGVLALAIAAVGLYSVIAYGITQRTHEMGVRVALGANPGDVVRLILGEGLRVVVPGIALGVVVALLAGRRIAPLLFNVSPGDPAIVVGVVATLLMVAICAAMVPAMRAARTNPSDALRAS